MLSIQNCPLCKSNSITDYFKSKKRTYLYCSECNLVFVPESDLLCEEEEKARYDLHENSIYDKGYRKFLKRMFLPIKDRIDKNAVGLDFGCGPGPALAEMFKENGFEIYIYDYFYHKKEENLSRNYDFITITEVVEHLYQPMKVLTELWNLLNQCGVLGIMTKQVISLEKFKSWHYKDDMTHVCFFSEETFLWLAQQFNAKLVFIGNDVIILEKIK